MNQCTGAVETKDPYANHLNRINPKKRRHYENFKKSAAYKRQIDIVFEALLNFEDLTDREIQQLTNLEISVIPARRADITNDNNQYRLYKIVFAKKRECRIMRTQKIAWAIKKIK